MRTLFLDIGMGHVYLRVVGFFGCLILFNVASFLTLRFWFHFLCFGTGMVDCYPAFRVLSYLDLTPKAGENTVTWTQAFC